MKNIALVFFLTFTLTKLTAQNIPELTSEKGNVTLQKLNVEVKILGNIAITTYDMQFYNPNNRVLEGELKFPLQQNQSVTRFALDINGNLREAVVVEQEKARVAFESTVRQNIDPALLEKTKGNNYKARVYPIPSKGYKRVVLAYQEELIHQSDSYFYKLPMYFKKKLSDFSLAFTILNQKNKPIVENNFLKGFEYNPATQTYSLSFKAKKYIPRNEITVKVPLPPTKDKLIISDNYFYYNKLLNIIPRKKKKVKRITIFWDTSLSQKNKNILSESNLLEAYFKTFENVKVKFVEFNITTSKTKNFTIKKGEWKALKKHIENQVYDGASSFDFFKKYKDNSDEYLIFTDGLNTLSKLNFEEFKKRTYLINSAVSSNHEVLTNIANATGGNYINLRGLTTKNALKKLENETLQLVDIDIDKNIDFYPKKRNIVSNNFSFVGNRIPKQNFTLYFGYGNEIVKKVEVRVNEPVYKNEIVKKRWASEKIKYLSKNKEDNRTEIVELSKNYKVISPFTSMLILDRIEDYVTHKIQPPKELLKEYKKLLATKIDDKKERYNHLKEDLFDGYNDYFSWYESKVKKNKKPLIIQNQPNQEQENPTENIVRNTTETNENNIQENSVRNNSEVRGSVRLVQGIVSDETGGLPGVVVLIKGTETGTETDFDGKYSINVKTGDVLAFSFIGMRTVEKTIETSSIINVAMESEAVLDEVVVTSYAAPRKRQDVGAVVRISSKEIVETVKGKVAGVSVRGMGSISTSSNPLYVLNGKIVSSITGLNPNNIKSMYVLKGEEGVKLYGNEGQNGVVVITTKNGADNNLESIKKFEEKVKEKLELKGWNPETPYLKELEIIKNNDIAYKKYLELRDKYGNSISYYIDVADFFHKRDEIHKAIKILSNVAEVDLDNYELLRALAYKFEEYKQYQSAVYIYKEIVKLRPEDIQSYRDLALAYQYIGKYQKSLDILHKIVNGTFLDKDENRRFEGIETIALSEMNRLITLYPKKLNYKHISDKLIHKMPLDFKVVIDWNHNDTDIDLWVIDPNKEKCYYKYKRTKIGGLMSNDMTEGFGPEQFSLKKAIKGEYKIKAKYYSDSQQKISGPTFLKVSVFKNYGKKNEERVVKLVRLKNKDDVIDLGTIVF